MPSQEPGRRSSTHRTGSPTSSTTCSARSGGLGSRSSRADRHCSGSTSAAVDSRIGRCGTFRSRPGSETWSASWTPQGSTGSSCSETRRAARSQSSMQHATRNGSLTSFCGVAYARGRLRRDPTPQDFEDAELQVKLIELGWAKDEPSYRDVFSRQLMPGGTTEQLNALSELERVSSSPANAARIVRAFYQIDVRQSARAREVPDAGAARARRPESSARGRPIARHADSGRAIRDD